MITARFENASATSAMLRHLIASLKNKGGFFKVWGHRTSLMAKTSARSHSKGGRFWPSIANLTKVTSASDSGAVVQCLHFAGAQKEYGGTITAKNAKFLTIPIAPEAKGKRAGEFENTFVMGGIIFQGIEHGKKKDGGLKALFVLKKSVNQKAEPWWPKPEPVLAQGLMLAGEQLEREMNK
jgi:hypothetical protein